MYILWLHNDPEKGDPEHGIKPGTNFDNLPEDWVCPVCFSPKKLLKKSSVNCSAFA